MSQSPHQSYFTKHAKYLQRDLRSGDPERVAGAVSRIRSRIPQLAGMSVEQIRDSLRRGDALKVVAAEQGHADWRSFSDAAFRPAGDPVGSCGIATPVAMPSDAFMAAVRRQDSHAVILNPGFSGDVVAPAFASLFEKYPDAYAVTFSLEGGEDDLWFPFESCLYDASGHILATRFELSEWEDAVLDAGVGEILLEQFGESVSRFMILRETVFSVAAEDRPAVIRRVTGRYALGVSGDVDGAFAVHGAVIQISPREARRLLDLCDWAGRSTVHAELRVRDGSVRWFAVDYSLGDDPAYPTASAVDAVNSGAAVSDFRSAVAFLDDECEAVIRIERLPNASEVNFVESFSDTAVADEDGVYWTAVRRHDRGKMACAKVPRSVLEKIRDHALP